MKANHLPRPLSLAPVLATLLVASATSALAADGNTQAPPPPHAAPAAAIPAGTDLPKTLPRVAAVVDGHPIPMDDVIAICLRQAAPRVTELLIQKYVVDQECKRRGIVVSQSEIDSRIEDLRKSIAPTTLEQGLQAHHQTRAMLEDDIRQTIERVRLVEDRVPPAKLVHCRVIRVKFVPTGAPEAITGTHTTETAAQTTLASIQQQLRSGKDFATLAARYSDLSREKSGDIGVLYDGIPDQEPALVHAALSLHKGETTPTPIRTDNGYFLIQAISTSDDHPSNETPAYTSAERTYKDQKAQYLVGQGLVDLLAKSKIEYNLPQ